VNDQAVKNMTLITKRHKIKSGQKVAEEEMTALEAAVEASTVHDVSPFARAYQAVHWQEHPADDFAHAVRLALSVGAPTIAQELAFKGAKRYPDHAELQKMAHILAPPTVSVSKASPRPGIQANRDWLNANWDDYRGRWVALRDGQLLAVADSLDGLSEQVGELQNTGILVTPLW
jgi:hypothetical protein